MKSLFGWRSLRHKLFFGVLLTTFSALLLADLALLAYDQRDFYTRSVADLDTQARLVGQISAAALQFDDPQTAAHSLALLRARPMIAHAALYTREGGLFAEYRREGVPETALPAPLPRDGESLEGERLSLFRQVFHQGELLGGVYLQADYRRDQRLRGHLFILLLISALALVLAMLLALWLQARVTRPILSLTGVARRVREEQDYGVRAERTTEDELGYLVDAFNGMLVEVQKRSEELERSNRMLARQIEERTQAEAAVVELNRELEQRVQSRTADLEAANRELEAFSYSVSHDLRAPLRAIDGFSQALLEDYADQIDERGRDFLQRVRAASQRMGLLIDDMLKLSRVSRSELNWAELDLSRMAEQILSELRAAEPQRRVETHVTPGLCAFGDTHLIRIALENLLGNAWKYTGRRDLARIELGRCGEGEEACFFVRDNGAGFDMTYANKLFNAFQRLHDKADFPGSGIGLATVQRILHRHGGRIWVEAEVDGGAVFSFTLPGERRD